MTWAKPCSSASDAYKLIIRLPQKYSLFIDIKKHYFIFIYINRDKISRIKEITINFVCLIDEKCVSS